MKNIRNTVLSIMDGIITVGVKFNDSDAKSYSYLALKNEGYKVGDVAIVDGGNCNKTVKVARVDEECDIDTDSDIEYKFLIARIDMDAHEEKNKKVEEAVAFFRKKQRDVNRASAKQAMLQDLGVTSDNLLLTFDNPNVGE